MGFLASNDSIFWNCINIQYEPYGTNLNWLINRPRVRPTILPLQIPNRQMNMPQRHPGINQMRSKRMPK